MAVGSRSDARDEATLPRIIKRLETPAVGSQSNASDAFLRDLISSIMTLAINGLPDLSHVSINLSEDQRLIRITCDLTLLAMPRLLFIVIVDRDPIGWL